MILMKHYHCPVNGWDCPYYKYQIGEEFCLCIIDNPIDECDDFYAMWVDFDPEDYTDETEE